MKAGSTKLSIFLACGLALGLAFTLGRASAPSNKKKDWVSLSRMSFGTRTNAGLVIPTVSVIVSNIGPQNVLFALGWFECRTKSDGAWLAAGNARADPTPTLGLLPLASGSSVPMTMDIKETDKPEDRMAFCMVEWLDRESGVNPIDQFMDRLCYTFNLNWIPRFGQPVVEHRAFSANIEFADYFYQMYWHRSNWTRINTNLNRSMFGLESRVDPGTDEWAARQALLVFEQFCGEVR
jgi:hypothetical protein